MKGEFFGHFTLDSMYGSLKRRPISADKEASFDEEVSFSRSLRTKPSFPKIKGAEHCCIVSYELSTGNRPCMLSKLSRIGRIDF